MVSICNKIIRMVTKLNCTILIAINLLCRKLTGFRVLWSTFARDQFESEGFVICESQNWSYFDTSCIEILDDLDIERCYIRFSIGSSWPKKNKGLQSSAFSDMFSISHLGSTWLQPRTHFTLTTSAVPSPKCATPPGDKLRTCLAASLAIRCRQWSQIIDLPLHREASSVLTGHLEELQWECAEVKGIWGDT